MKGLKSNIIDAIADQTGINLSPKDLQVTPENNILTIKLWGQAFFKKKFVSEKSLETEEFAEDLTSDLLDEYYDVREKIIDLKIAYLNEAYSDDIYDHVIEILEKNKVDEKLLDMLDVEFVDYSSGSSKYDDEDMGYPVFALRITDFEDFDYYRKIDIFKDPLTFDYEKISKELISEIR